MPFRYIAAATDFSVDGNNAVRRAVSLAERHNARLTIVHVVDVAATRSVKGGFSPSHDLPTRLAQARINLHRLARDLIGDRDLLATVEVQTDKRIDALIRIADRSDLLVVGQRARRPLADLIQPHCAYLIARKSRRPVLVVRQAAHSPYRRILLPVNFSASCDAAASVAASIARDARLEIFHAYRPSRDLLLHRARVAPQLIRETQAFERRQLIERLRRRFGRPGPDRAETIFSVGQGPTAPSILSQVQLRDVDLMVTGKQRRSWLAAAVAGSVCLSLLKGSDCDVLIVPHPAFEALPTRVEPSLWPASTTA